MVKPIPNGDKIFLMVCLTPDLSQMILSFIVPDENRVRIQKPSVTYDIVFILQKSSVYKFVCSISKCSFLIQILPFLLNFPDTIIVVEMQCFGVKSYKKLVKVMINIYF
jgi:hypothetical protein